MSAKIVLITLLLTAWAAVFSAAQPGTVTGTGEVSELYREAEAALLSHNYRQAIRLFDRVLKSHPDLAAAHRGLGLSYQLLKDYENAAYHFDRVIELDSMFSRAVYFEAGEAQYKMGNAGKALTYFERFDTLQAAPAEAFGYHGNREREVEQEYLVRLTANLRACRISLDSANFKGIREIVNLGPAVNTGADEYFPCLSNDQQLMYYTRRRNAQSDEDLFYSTASPDGQWAPGSGLGAFNSGQNEGMTTLVRNGRIMFFTACGREGVLGTCDIWQAEVEKLQIRGMNALEGYSNSERWDSQAAISCDGSNLFFASNREGGQGGTDLWVSTRESDGRWKDPVNLGSKVNTPLDEQSPFITNDGKNLYFVSNGHPGLGEQDIFVSWLDDQGQWSDPINLGPPGEYPLR